MPHYTQEEIERAQQTDLEDFLHTRGEILRRAGSGEFLWEKEQVWIHGCRWYTHYEQIGGRAISFVMKYGRCDFRKAVAVLLGDAPPEPADAAPDTKRELPCPEKPPASPSFRAIYAYLLHQRCISRDIITFFVRNGTLYESRDDHSCVFIGLGEDGQPRHIHRRSIRGKFRKNEKGSCAEYSFHYNGTDSCLYVFEGPIDLLAYLTLHPENWQAHSYTALCSVSDRALLHRLRANPHLRTIFLCLDQDSAGQNASRNILEKLHRLGYTDVHVLLPAGKDWGEDAQTAAHLSGSVPGEPVSAPPHGENPPENGPLLADEVFRNRQTSLGREAIARARSMPVPFYLYSRIRDLYAEVCENSGIPAEQPTERPPESLTKRLEKLCVMLLQLAWEESRKCLAPVSWEEIEAQLTDCLQTTADAPLRQLVLPMQSLARLYAQPVMDAAPALFLQPLVQAAAGCIRILAQTEEEI